MCTEVFMIVLSATINDCSAYRPQISHFIPPKSDMVALFPIFHATMGSPP